MATAALLVFRNPKSSQDCAETSRLQGALGMLQHLGLEWARQFRVSGSAYGLMERTGFTATIWQSASFSGSLGPCKNQRPSYPIDPKNSRARITWTHPQSRPRTYRHSYVIPVRVNSRATLHQPPKSRHFTMIGQALGCCSGT